MIGRVSRTDLQPSEPEQKMAILFFSAQSWQDFSKNAMGISPKESPRAKSSLVTKELAACPLEPNC
jgi:hypothetical protein